LAANYTWATLFKQTLRWSAPTVSMVKLIF
jgi:hypothetical protein